MKKALKLFLFLVMVWTLNTGIAWATEEKNAFQSKKINVVVTTFPIYDFVREIIGQNHTNINLEIIIDNGIDLHNFQPSTQDIASISTADVFIYNGGDSDVWIKKILAQAMNKNMKVINLMHFLGGRVKEELIVEGMEKHDHAGHNHGSHGHDGHKHEGHEHDGHDECSHEGHNHAHMQEGVIYDEHVWLSLKNAVLMCKTIARELQAVDSANAAYYAKNTRAYVKKLQKLDADYEKSFKESPNKIVLFADRFAFRYLLDDYKIGYFAAFPGCSAETEASFDTVIFLSKKMNELKLQKVLIIDNSTNNIAKAVIKNSDNTTAQILSLNSLQTITAKELANGVSYLRIMEDNLKKLKEALE